MKRQGHPYEFIGWQGKPLMAYFTDGAGSEIYATPDDLKRELSLEDSQRVNTFGIRIPSGAVRSALKALPSLMLENN